ncbi:MAG TPA: hypothetical protein H9761_19150 [Candidatus Eisenbergiella merdavium]|uniref:Uncharacterized protein n=1 Tax=Candidatus Eisenbergiella merdavium TaxID=2838551 RepID=A0A9D2NJX2_9FIRM|nr:hypothetical protein [Candidatus Eisenbergiella merdavium]
MEKKTEIGRQTEEVKKKDDPDRIGFQENGFRKERSFLRKRFLKPKDKNL